MYRGTTPTFRLTLSDQAVDLTQANNVYATFKGSTQTITKSGEDLVITPQEVDVYMSQEETLGFSQGTIAIQLNWTYDDNKRACSTIVRAKISENLLAEVVE